VFAGPEGLDLIKPLITVAATLLKPGGHFAMEHDDTQGDTVPKLLSGRKILADVEEHVDLNGRPRLVTARRVALAPR
jgi:release factor glutamine methyltransferase